MSRAQLVEGIKSLCGARMARDMRVHLIEQGKHIMATTDLAIMESDLTGAKAEIAEFATGNVSIFSTVPSESFEDKMKTLEATSNSVRLKEVLGQKLQLVHFILQAVTINDDTKEEVDGETGDITPGKSELTRVVLITKDGKSYHAISKGVLSSLRNIYGLVGDPKGWPSPITVTPVLLPARNGFEFMSLKLG